MCAGAIVNLSTIREDYMASAPTYSTFGTEKGLAAVVFGFALLALASSPVCAQDQNQYQNPATPQASAEMDMAKPAPILVIYKEDVKAGRVTSHDQLEANYARAYSKMPGGKYYLAMNSISGPNQSWFMQPFNSFEEVEKEFQANERAPMAIRTSLRQIASGELDNLTSQAAITTVYREDLSYKASMSDLPRTRYVEVVSYRVRPGHDNEFVEAAKLVQAAYQKADIPMQWATYQVYAGAPSGTYYVFRALDSLAKADPTNMQMMQSFDKALGEEGGKRLMQLVSDGIAMREVNFYAFNPQTSFAPPEFAAADSFWARPSQLAQVGTSGKTKTSSAAKKKQQ
jgi:hypothetical protein